MPQLIKDRAIVEDSWLLLQPATDGAQPDIPATGDIIVPLSTWQQHKPELLQRAGAVGVWLAAGEEPESLAADLAQLPLIAIDFPVFTDGRGFSSARLLRERLGFEGEIRAIGDVFRDQLWYMSRCGFNAFAIKEGKSVEDALQGLHDFSEAYQVSVERPRPLFLRR